MIFVYLKKSIVNTFTTLKYIFLTMFHSSFHNWFTVQEVMLTHKWFVWIVLQFIAENSIFRFHNHIIPELLMFSIGVYCQTSKQNPKSAAHNLTEKYFHLQEKNLNFIGFFIRLYFASSFVFFLFNAITNSEQRHSEVKKNNIGLFLTLITKSMRLKFDNNNKNHHKPNNTSKKDSIK